MKITSINVNKHLASTLGLASSKMKNLGGIVVLTGQNGCGKTRLLSAIDWLLHECLNQGYKQIRETLSDLKSPDHLFNSHPSKHDVDQYSYSGLMQSFRHQLAELESASGIELNFETQEREDESLRNYLEISALLKRPLELTLNYTAKLSIGMTRDLADTSHNGLLSSPLSYLLDICSRVEKEIQNHASNEDEIEVISIYPGIFERFKDLQALMLDLLGLELSHTGHLDKIALNEISLSEGQARLLRWIVLFNSTALKKISIPLLLDEPEIHLHPHALNKLINHIINRAPKCQIWLATHSISLIAHLAADHPRSIWFGNRGVFNTAGKELPVVVQALLGGEGGDEKLIDYCLSPERFAFNTFCAECLSPPQTVAYKSGDPQVEQILGAIYSKNVAPIALLDFGAGQGRLLDGLADAAKSSGANCDLNTLFSYYAYEPDPESLIRCQETICSYYPGEPDRAFSSQETISEELSFDLVVMANLLHEVLPDNWITDIFQGSAVGSNLKKEGHVLLIEDTLLPTGELAHNLGFIMLDQSALEILFKTTQEDKDAGLFIANSTFNNRLQATLIGKQIFLRVDKNSIMEALKHQRTSAVNSIKNLRKNSASASYMDGRKHAYYTQLVTNITLALDDFE
ncbi:AAA family ATPase [Pseudomonas fluorescens]|uniref:AAA family ATPase n=1 Tax=Pseudomonas fluorescens TaxID=294 RepID=UPI001914922F